MSKLITFFLFMFIGCTILSAIMEGGGGIVAAELHTAVDDADTTLVLDSTTQFETADYVIIGSEKISYTGKTATDLTGCTRGYQSTDAVAHAAGSMVYTPEANLVENALGFNIATTTDSMGAWAVVTIPYKFLTRTLPNVVSMNYSFLTGYLGIIGWFIIAIGASLVIVIAISLAGGRRI